MRLSWLESWHLTFIERCDSPHMFRTPSVVSQRSLLYRAQALRGLHKGHHIKVQVLRIMRHELVLDGACSVSQKRFRGSCAVVDWELLATIQFIQMALHLMHATLHPSQVVEAR